MTYIMPRRAFGNWADDLLGTSGGSDPTPTPTPAPDDSGFNDGSTETVNGGPSTASSNDTLPAGGYVNKAGVCKATDDAALSQFKELQRQCNRVLDYMAKPKIAVDGAIGAGTLGALQTIATQASAGAYSLSSSSVNMNDCTAVSAQALVLTTRLMALGDFLGAPGSVSSPSPPSTPTIVDPVTGIEQPQGFTASASDMLGNMSTTEKLGLAALAVGVGFFMFKKKKG